MRQSKTLTTRAPKTRQSETPTTRPAKSETLTTMRQSKIPTMTTTRQSKTLTLQSKTPQPTTPTLQAAKNHLFLKDPPALCQEKENNDSSESVEGNDQIPIKKPYVWRKEL